MPKPWERYGGQAAPQGGVYSLPQSPQQQATEARQARSDAREQARFEQQQREWFATHNPDGTKKEDTVSLTPAQLAVTGPQFLSTLNQSDQAQVRALTEGRMAFPTGKAAASPYWQQRLQWVSQYDPSFDAVNYNARAGTRRDFTSGSSSKNIKALNTAIGHLGQLGEQIDGTASHGGFPLATTVNAVENAYKRGRGDSGVTLFDQTAGALAGELTQVYRQSGGAEADIQRYLSELSPNASREQKRAAITNMVGLLKSRLDAINDQYTKGMGTTAQPLQVLDPHAQQVVAKFGPGSTDGGGGSGGNNPFGGLPGKNDGGGGGGIGPDPRFAGKRFNENGQPDPRGDYDAYGHIADPETIIGPQSGKTNPDGTWAGANGVVHAPDGSIVSGWKGPAQGSYEGYLKDQLAKQGGGDPNSFQNLDARSRHGTLASLDDEISGIGGGLGWALQGRDPVTGYYLNRDIERYRQQQNASGQGLAGTALEIGSSIPTALLMGGGEGVTGAAMNGMRYGAVDGFGRGNGMGGSALGAVGGAIGGGIGGGVGGALGKYVAAPLSRRFTNLPVVQGALDRVTGGNFEPVPNPTPLENAMNKIAPNIAAVRDRVQTAQDLGVPYALADASPQLRMLAGKVSRTSPDARSIAENYLEPRNMGQVDRLNTAIDTHLAPRTNITDRGNQILDAADQEAAPHYNLAFDRPGPVDPQIAAMLNTPGGRGGLAMAKTVAENRQLDPNKLGFDLNAQGEPILKSVPSYETLQLVKRGLDGHLNSFKDPLGKLDVRGNPVAQSVLDLKNNFNARLGDINSNYAKGNEVWSGYAARKNALDAGFGDLPSMPPRDVQSYVSGLNPQTLGEAQRGYATSMADRAEKLRYTTNPWEAVYGSPAAQQSVGHMFPGGADQFGQQYGLERDMAKTSLEALGGSQTAARQAIDSAYNGSLALPAEAISTLHGAPGAGTLLAKAGNWLARRGADKIANRDAASLAPVLFNDADKIGLLNLLDNMAANNAKRTTAANATARRTGLFGSVLAPNTP